MFSNVDINYPIFSTRLQNIEDTEKAKRKLIDDTRREESEPKPYEGK